jgi:phage shock protein A
MGVMTRIFRLFKADLHGVMDQVEDKALLLKQCVREMEGSLQQKRQQLDGLNRTSRQMDVEREARERERQKVAADLDLAVRKEKDDIARALIRKRLVLEADDDRLASRLQQLDAEHARLAEVIRQQEEQLERLKAKCAAYWQQTERCAVDDADETWGDAAGHTYPTEAEIELELLRCKESAAQGGVPQGGVK